MITIGRLEMVQLHDLYSNNISAKIDTGAYHSSIGCKVISVVGNFVTFSFNNRIFTMPVKTKKTVRNANGSEVRIFIELDITLASVTSKELFSISDRSKLKNQVLIGRKSLSKRFTVDVSKSFIMGK